MELFDAPALDAPVARTYPPEPEPPGTYVTDTTTGADPVVPDGVVPLRHDPSEDRCFLDAAAAVDVDVGTGEYVVEWDDQAEVVVFDRSTGPTPEPTSSHRIRGSAGPEVPVPPAVATALGVDPAGPGSDDPFLFEVAVETVSTVVFSPLAPARDVFRRATHLGCPIPEEIVVEASEQFGLDPSGVARRLALVAKTLGVQTFVAAGVPFRDDPECVAHGGRRLAVYDAPTMDGNPDGFRSIAGLYGLSDRVASACRVAHGAYARSLCLCLYGGERNLPLDHPLRHDADMFVVPLDRPRKDVGSAVGDRDGSAVDTDGRSGPDPGHPFTVDVTGSDRPDEFGSNPVFTDEVGSDSDEFVR